MPSSPHSSTAPFGESCSRASLCAALQRFADDVRSVIALLPELQGRGSVETALDISGEEHVREIAGHGAVQRVRPIGPLIVDRHTAPAFDFIDAPATVKIAGDLKAIASCLDSPINVTKARGSGDIFDNIEDMLEVLKYAHDRGMEVLNEPLRLNFDPGPFAAAIMDGGQDTIQQGK